MIVMTLAHATRKQDSVAIHERKTTSCATMATTSQKRTSVQQESARALLMVKRRKTSQNDECTCKDRWTWVGLIGPCGPAVFSGSIFCDLRMMTH